MGTEILDFDPERPPAAPGPRADAPFDRALDVVDLDETGADRHAERPRGSTTLARWLGRLRTDGDQRRRLARLVALLLLVAIVTAAVAQQRADRQAAQAEDTRLAVDVRVDHLPSLDDPSVSPGPRGQSFLPLKVHNLGERPVHLTALLYRLPGDRGQDRTLLDVDVAIPPGQLLNRAYRVALPCGPTPETAITGPATMTALIRTADGVTHVVPTDVSALDEMGGVFAACSVYAHAYGAYDANSQVDHGGVHITLSLPSVDLVGSNFVEVGVLREGLPDAITFLTTPKLPAESRAGTRISVRLRPVVRSCPRGVDLTNLPSLGLRIGPDTYPDPYLPLLVAQAIGRACAGPSR